MGNPEIDLQVGPVEKWWTQNLRKNNTNHFSVDFSEQQNVFIMSTKLSGISWTVADTQTINKLNLGSLLVLLQLFGKGFNLI